MACSTDFYLLVLLDAYVGPTPSTADFVRKELLCDEQLEDIRSSIYDRIGRPGYTNGLYRAWLNHSGLDFENKSSTLIRFIEKGILQHALFDLMLGRRVKSLQLGYYSEVHQLRNLVGELVGECSDSLGGIQLNKLWWDGIDPLSTAHRPWVSPELRRDPGFIQILESWLSDSEWLQKWLDDFEAEAPVVNDPSSPDRIFSEKVATIVLGFAMVRSLGGCELGPTD